MVIYLPRGKGSFLARREKDSRSEIRKRQLDYLYKKYKGICQLCFIECDRAQASRDHVKAIALCTKEEARDIKNMVLAHVKCNQNRHRKIHPSQELNGPERLTYNIGDLFPNLGLAIESN